MPVFMSQYNLHEYLTLPYCIPWSRINVLTNFILYNQTKVSLLVYFIMCGTSTLNPLCDLLIYMIVSFSAAFKSLYCTKVFRAIVIIAYLCPKEWYNYILHVYEYDYYNWWMCFGKRLLLNCFTDEVLVFILFKKLREHWYFCN